jgi:hypothetical protein
MSPTGWNVTRIRKGVEQRSSEDAKEAGDGDSRCVLRSVATRPNPKREGRRPKETPNPKSELGALQPFLDLGRDTVAGPEHPFIESAYPRGLRRERQQPQPVLPQPLRQRPHHRPVFRAVAEEDGGGESCFHFASRLAKRQRNCEGVDAAAAGATWSSTQRPNSKSQTPPGAASRLFSEARQTGWLISGDQVMRQWRLTRRLHTVLPIARPS